MYHLWEMDFDPAFFVDLRDFELALPNSVGHWKAQKDAEKEHFTTFEEECTNSIL